MNKSNLIGKLVFSKAGRDKNNPYLIVNVIAEDYVYLANGSTKKIEMPKKKKIKHLNFTEIIDEELKNSILNNEDNLDLKIKNFIKFEGIDKEVWLPYVKRWCNRNARNSFRVTT